MISSIHLLENASFITHLLIIQARITPIYFSFITHCFSRATLKASHSSPRQVMAARGFAPAPTTFTAARIPTYINGVSTPADDPGVTAVGGGNLVTTVAPPTNHSAYVSENGFGDLLVPNDPYGLGVNVSGGIGAAGGGRSTIFSQPPYQALVYTGSTKRALPDVGMQVGGCPLGTISFPCGPQVRSYVYTAYAVGIGGGYYGLIGTSVASPEFVGALALYEQTASRQGNVNYYLYNAGAAQTAAGGPTAPSNKQYFHRGMGGFDGWYTISRRQLQIISSALERRTYATSSV